MDAFAYAQRTVVRRIRMGKLAWLDRDPEFGRACTCAHRYVEPLIRRALARRQSSSEAEGKKEGARDHEELDGAYQRYCFLDELVKEEDNPEQIRGQVLNILVARRDTTASLLSSLFFVISRRSDVMAKLQDEVAEINGREPTYEEIKGMKYLNNLIRETLRLYAVVPMNVRVANKDTTLPVGGGPDGQSPVYVREGQKVVYQVYSLHRRTDLWGQNADEFRPERWYDARPNFEYLPFNAGPRICPGKS